MGNANMGNAEFFKISKFPFAQSGLASDASFIFNPENEKAFRLSIQHGLELICGQLRDVNQPFTGVTPQTLAREFAKLDLEKPLDSLHQVLTETYQLYLKDAVYFHHPNYLAHLNCPIVYPAILAELILSSVNSSLDTWDQSAGGTLIEQSLIDWTVKQIGLGKQADGIFTSGGTQSNLMALLLARDHFCLKQEHSVKHKGLPLEAARYCIFTSKHSHFSVQKSAAILGLGYQSVVAVECDDNYRLCTEDLQNKVDDCRQQGKLPIAVVATAGTTDFGSIDPLNSIADLCAREELWLHVDAAYGCGLLASKQNRHKLDGIERANSVTVDYHKSFFQPVSCGAFFVRDKTHLQVVTHHADYLNPLSQLEEGTPNLVNKSIQTTRRFDALKLWLSFRMMGPALIGDYFDQLLTLAQSVYQKMRADPQIEVLNQPELSALVFRFVASEAENEPLDLCRLDLCRLNQKIRKQLFASGEAVIAGTKVDGLSYLKFTLLNPTTSAEQIEQVIARIKSIGRELLYSDHQIVADGKARPRPSKVS